MGFYFIFLKLVQKLKIKKIKKTVKICNSNLHFSAIEVIFKRK